MDIAALRTLALVAQHGSIAAAARVLGLDPSSVSRSVATTEAALTRLAAAGVDRVTVPVSQMAGLKAMVTSLEDVAKWRPIIAQYGG